MTSLSPLSSLPVRRLVAGLVTVGLLAGQPLAATAAGPACLDGYSSDAGQVAGCAAIRIGGIPFGYPTLKWDTLARVTMPVSAQVYEGGVPSSTQTELLANRAAQALQVDAAQVSNAIAAFPSNVPYVVARYNPMDMTLRVDVFKVEKTAGAGEASAVMQHMQFTPAHGRMWAANRSYISPASYLSGAVPGRNPFEAFTRMGSDNFHSVTMNAAQVVVGHAMRATGAGVALFGTVQPRISSRTTKSGGVFKKTIRTWIYGHAKTAWTLGLPLDALDRSSSTQSAAYCVADPAATDCPLYEVANAGVSFEAMSGGTFEAFEDTWTLDFKKSSGLTFAGGLLLGGLFGLGLSGLFGLSSSFAGFTSINGGGLAGVLGDSAPRVNATLPLAGFGASPFTTESIAGDRMLSGANLATTADPALNLTAALTSTVTVGAGTAAAPTLDRYGTLLNAKVSTKTTGDISTALSDAKSTMLGVCSAADAAQSCGGSAGLLPRADNYVSGDYGFLRDGGGVVLRDSGALFGQ